MKWGRMFGALEHGVRARLVRNLDEGRLYAKLAARADDGADVEWVVACIDRAIDALAAARVQLDAWPVPRPWDDEAYRAYRGHHPISRIRVAPAELDALRAALRQRNARGDAPRGTRVASPR